MLGLSLSQLHWTEQEWSDFSESYREQSQMQLGPPREEGDHRDEKKQGQMYEETKEEPGSNFLVKNVFIKCHCIWECILCECMAHEYVLFLFTTSCAGTDCKESARNVGDGVQSLGWEDPLEREWQPTSVFLPGESHGFWSLEGYRPQGCKELDMTEQLTLSLCLSLGSSIYWPSSSSYS